MSKTRKCSQKNSEDRMINTIEDLREFDDFKQKVLPAIRKAMAAGKSTKEILDIAKAMATARLATIACTSTDEKNATAAIEKLLQRTDGPVVQKQESTHKFEKLPEEQLDAILLTKLARAQEDSTEDDESQH